MTKKEQILELAANYQGKPFGRDEIRVIQAQIKARLGPTEEPSEAYVAQILVNAGGIINYPNPFVSPPLPEPYGSKLQGTLRFNNLEEAEKSLKRLHAYFSEYLLAQDRTGTALVRKIITKGRDRARMLAANSRVSASKREEKEEIARWFGVWMDTPDLFFDWLELRKKSGDFRRCFPADS